MLPSRALLTLTLAMTLAASGMAGAEGLKLSGSTKNRTALFKSQTALLDGRLSKQYDFSDRLKPNAPKGKDKVETAALPRYKGNYKGAYLEVAKAAARKRRGFLSGNQIADILKVTKEEVLTLDLKFINGVDDPRCAVHDTASGDVVPVKQRW